MVISYPATGAKVFQYDEILDDIKEAGSQGPQNRDLEPWVVSLQVLRAQAYPRTLLVPGTGPG